MNSRSKGKRGELEFAHYLSKPLASRLGAGSSSAAARKVAGCGMPGLTRHPF
jgi:hypothetical protein